MELLLISLSLLVCLLIFLLFKQYFFTSPLARCDQSMVLMQQQVESLRSDVRSSLQHITESVNQQLSMVTNQIQSQTSTVGSHLDNASRVIGDVQRNLGELGQATQEIKELGQSVSKLEELLRAPKLRGGLGEFLLEDLLKQVLPNGYFRMQHHFRDGQIVDAAVYTSDRIAPIDSKFPLENFRRMITACSEDERKVFQRAFVGDVKKHIDTIATKYILPDEGTFPFAFMYIPAENIYYEVIIRDDGIANGSDLYGYALERKVIPVSPNSLYAYLQIVALGLRGLCIEQSAREIVDALTRLQSDITRLREAFDTLGTHLDNAHKKFEDANKRLSGFEVRLTNLTDHHTADASQKQQILNHGQLLS